MKSKQSIYQGSVASIAEADVCVLNVRATVGDVRRALHERNFKSVDLILLADEQGRYAGVVETIRLLPVHDDTPMSSFRHVGWPSVSPSLDQEHAAELAFKLGVSILVVVEDERPLGVVTALSLLRVMAHEHHEDMNRFVGIMAETRDATAALESNVLHRVAKRLPWLLVGLALSSFATAAMSHFENVLKANVTLALFIPAVIYITDAVGTQTEAIAVRGLSLSHRPIGNIMFSEVLTGGLIGIILGAIALAAVWIVFGDPRIAWGVAISLAAGGTTASIIGLTLPWLLSQARLDPAFGSGPVATVLQEVLTVIVYFEVMVYVLGSQSVAP